MYYVNGGIWDNIGNAYYRRGVPETALEFYKRSMDLDPKDMDAKFNYEFVQNRVKELKDKEERTESQQKQQEKKMERSMPETN